MRLPPQARLLFIGLISQADDEGRGIAETVVLKAKIFPSDYLGLGQLEEWLGKIVFERMARIYVVDDTTYYDLPKWSTYQKINRPTPSILPVYPAGLIEDSLMTHAQVSIDEVRLDESPVVPFEGDARGVALQQEIPGAEAESEAEALDRYRVFWNEHVAPILKAPLVRVMTDERASKLRKLLKKRPDNGLAFWDEVLQEIPLLAEKFRTEAGWITFDFFLKKDHHEQWVTGNYRSKHEQWRITHG